LKVGDFVEGEMPMMAGSKSRQEVIEVGDLHGRRRSKEHHDGADVGTEK